MSMLSKQCKELRAEAERIGYWNPTASRLMFDAADILWSLRNKNVALLGENDKLRDLVRDMWPHVRHRSRMCGECELPCDTSDECLLYEPMRQRMVELGIEVDE